MNRLLSLAFVSLALACGGMDTGAALDGRAATPGTGTSIGVPAPITTPIAAPAPTPTPVPVPDCDPKQNYGACTCKSGGNGVVCNGAGTCSNCDPGFSQPTGPTVTCHCE